MADRTHLIGNDTPDIEEPYDCKHFDSCSAPLCPLASMGGIWYPDEPVCRCRSNGSTRLIANQRAIARKAKDAGTFFTARMLDRNIIIKTGITGLDPDGMTTAETPAAEDKWIKAHPSKKPLAGAIALARRQQMEKIRKARSPKYGPVTGRTKKI